MFKTTKSFAATAALSLFSATSAVYGQAAPDPAEMAQLDIVPGWRTEQGTYMVGLRIALAPGWQTYWRAPGDSGIPPQVSWDGSKNLGSVTFHWPTPSMFFKNGTRSIGYEKTVVIPMEVTPQSGDEGPVTLQGQVDLGVCYDVCLPLSASISARLAGPGAENEDIRASLENQPTPAREAGLEEVECRVTEISDGMQLTVKLDVGPGLPDDFVVIELREPKVWVSSAIMEHGPDGLTATSDMVPGNAQPFEVDLDAVRMTVLRRDGAIDIQGCSG